MIRCVCCQYFVVLFVARLHWLHVLLSKHKQQIFLLSSCLISLSAPPPPPAGESGYYAEAAFRDGYRTPAPVRLQLTSEWVLRRGGCPWHHEQPPGRDERGQIGRSSTNLVKDIKCWDSETSKDKLTLWTVSPSKKRIWVLHTTTEARSGCSKKKKCCRGYRIWTHSNHLCEKGERQDSNRMTHMWLLV